MQAVCASVPLQKGHCVLHETNLRQDLPDQMAARLTDRLLSQRTHSSHWQVLLEEVFQLQLLCLGWNSPVASKLPPCGPCRRAFLLFEQEEVSPRKGTSVEEEHSLCLHVHAQQKVHQGPTVCQALFWILGRVGLMCSCSVLRSSIQGHQKDTRRAPAKKFMSSLSKLKHPIRT